MIGRNEFIINEGTIKMVLQDWLNKILIDQKISITTLTVVSRPNVAPSTIQLAILFEPEQEDTK